jgi:hypothetical protein
VKDVENAHTPSWNGYGVCDYIVMSWEIWAANMLKSCGFFSAMAIKVVMPVQTLQTNQHGFNMLVCITPSSPSISQTIHELECSSESQPSLSCQALLSTGSTTGFFQTDNQVSAYIH